MIIVYKNSIFECTNKNYDKKKVTIIHREE